MSLLLWVDDGAVMTPEEAAAARKYVQRYSDDPKVVALLWEALGVADEVPGEDAEGR